jgi:hypothetical protein
VKKIVSLLAMTVLAACSGDSTGSRPSFAGQWLYRALLNEVGDQQVRCTVSGVVTLQQQGGSVSGHMARSAMLCVYPPNGFTGTDRTTFDSTTTVSGTVQGDSLLLTLQGPGVAVRQSVRLLGDSLAGTVLETGGGVVGARRFADSVRLGRTTVQVSGGATQTVELYARMDGPTPSLVLEGPGNASALLRLFAYSQGTTLSTGTFTVGGPGSTYAGSYMGPLAASGYHEPDLPFTSGQITITHADAQVARGSFDVSGPDYATGAMVRIQADFVAVMDRHAVKF